MSSYKRNVLEVNRIMKQYERKDNNYLSNMRDSIDEVQKAIRRTDTVFSKENLEDEDDN